MENPRSGGGEIVPPAPMLLVCVCVWGQRGGLEGEDSRRLIHFPGIFNEAPLPFCILSCLGAGSLVGMCLAFPGERSEEAIVRALFTSSCAVCGRLLRFWPSFPLHVVSCCVSAWEHVPVRRGGVCSVWLIGSCLAWGVSGRIWINRILLYAGWKICTWFV